MITPASQTVSVNEMSAEEFADYLDRRIDDILGHLEECETYRLLADPNTDHRTMTAILKYILLEVFSYGPHIIEATFGTIGRLPKNRPDLMRPMLLHNLEEVDHSEMALADYVRMGGDEAWARSRRITPESFAVGAVCRMLAERESPYAYLGYMYLLEGLTPILAERVRGFMGYQHIPEESRHFIDFHAKEDIGHALRLRKLIGKVVRAYPEAKAAIDYGFDCFTAVYPLPVWAAAVRQEQGRDEPVCTGAGLTRRTALSEVANNRRRLRSPRTPSASGPIRGAWSPCHNGAS